MARTTRRKAPAQSAPQTTEEATIFIGRYLASTLAIDRLKVDAAADIAAIEARRDEAIAPLELALKSDFAAVRAWWAVEGPTLTEGKRKSIELAGAMLGDRTTPPKLHFGKATEDSLIEALRAAGLVELVRTKDNLDKPAILKALSGDDAEFLAEMGFASRQRDEFFIDVAGTKDVVTEAVAEQSA